MRGAMTPSSLQSHSFLHAFLFWGVFMNDLKSDPFLSPAASKGADSEREESEEGRRIRMQRFPVLGGTRNQIAAPLITHQTWIA